MWKSFSIVATVLFAMILGVEDVQSPLEAIGTVLETPH